MAKKFLNLLAGEFAARAMQALGMVLLTRHLGKDGVGVYGLAAAIASYGLLLIVLGIDPIAIRAVHQKTLDPRAATSQIFSLRLLVAAVLVLLAAVYAWTGAAAGPVLVVLSLSFIANALTPRWLLLATGDVRPLALASVLSQGIFLAVVIYAPRGAVIAATGASLGEAVSAAVCSWAARKHSGAIRLGWDKQLQRRILREARPVAISMVMGTMMANFDVLALAILGRQGQIGLYVTAYRPLTFFAPLLTILQNLILPRYAQAWPGFARIRNEVWFTAIVVLLACSATAALICWQAPLVLRTLFGAPFVEGTPLLRILVWTLLPQGVRSVFRQVLYAFRLERNDLWNVQGAVATNVILDFAIIPRYGAMGCAVSTLASEIVYLGATCWLLRRRVIAPHTAV